MTRLTKSNFESLAALLSRELTEPGGVLAGPVRADRVIAMLADWCETTNPAFDRGRFLKAVWGAGGGVRALTAPTPAADPWVCEWCGSEAVEELREIWVNANTGELGEDDSGSGRQTYCNECAQHEIEIVSRSTRLTTRKER